MKDISPACVFRFPVVRMYPANFDVDEHVPRSGYQAVENYLTAETVLREKCEPVPEKSLSLRPGDVLAGKGVQQRAPYGE